MATESAESTEKDTNDNEQATEAKADEKPEAAEAKADEKPEAAEAKADEKPEAAEAKADEKPEAALPKPGAAKAAKPGAAKSAKPGAAGPKRPTTRKSGFSLRNVILFGGLVALLLAGFGVLGTRDQGGPSNAPKWKLNEPVDVEITLVASDAGDLGCAMEGEVEGLHCAYSTQTAKHPSAGGPRDDGKLLQPYATTNKQNFLAAGVWLQADTKDAVALDAKVKTLANPRFSLTCKFTPRGRAKAAKVQWKPGSDWGAGDGWYVGDVKDCKLVK